MRPAGHHPKIVGWNSGRGKATAVRNSAGCGGGWRRFESADTAFCPEEAGKSWGEHYPEGRHCFDNQRDIDGEFTVAVQKLPRAIQGVDQKKLILQSRHMTCRYAFLRDDRNPWSQLFETSENNVL